MTAICVRCGEQRGDFRAVCPSCGHRPEGDGVLVAWLLSSENLDDDKLAATAARIRRGEPIRPSAKMLKRARRALGRQLATDPGLDVRQLGALLVGNLLFSPLLGWTCAFWWYGERPRAALQAGLVSLPVSLLGTGIWLWVAFGGTA